MSNKVYDIITVGGGPSGLLCTITAITGTPINTPRGFTALVLDKDEIGEFAKYARLRLTHNWHLEGWQVIEFLKQEAALSGIEMKSREAVTDVVLENGLKVVKTAKGEYKAKKLAVCTGFYPYGNWIKHSHFIRPIFGPIEWEVPYIPQEKGYKIAIIGGQHTTCPIALKLKELRPDLHVIVVIDETDETDKIADTVVDSAAIDSAAVAAKAGKAESLEIYYGSIDLKSAKRKKIKMDVYPEEGAKKTINCQYALINYNSYIHKARSTDFLANLGIQRVNGYIPVDRDGNTGIDGIVAAGNIVTPVSGVLTAFSTGFTAGLNLFTQLHKEYYQEVPVLYPWLPLDNPLQHVLVKPTGKQ